MNENAKLLKSLIGKELLFSDGAMGTLLQAEGMKGGEIPETWNITHPEVLTGIHTRYLNAGSNIITANTFGANKYKLEHCEYDLDTLIGKGIELVRIAIDKFEKESNSVYARKPHFAALDVGPLGKLLKPIGNVSFDEAEAAYTEIVKAGVKAGADLLFFETFTDLYDLKAAIIAAKENSDLPLFVSVAPDENGRLLTGGDLEAYVALVEGLGVDVLGMNCGFGPKQFLKFLPVITKVCSTPIIVQPNAGLPKVVNGVTTFDVGPEEFSADELELVKGGAAIVGGCCGSTPEHINAAIRMCESSLGRPVTDTGCNSDTDNSSTHCDSSSVRCGHQGILLDPVAPKNLTVISSYTHAVYFGDKPLLIGERINPTGKKALKQALRDKDINYIINEAIAEEEAGSDILDVNVGLPEIDECEMMETAIEEITAISTLPLQIDTSDIKTMERALRIYNGKPLLNSVNGKQESMEAVLPLAKKYGAAVVALTLDESGIPETADERVAIAEKIINKAKEYGIDKKDLIFDSLTMTVSTDINNAKVTLEALRKIHETFGVNTILGVSNVSFGLPLRSIMTSTFFTLAMENGLSAGIINPLDERLMAAYDSFLTLRGFDNQCLRYIEKYSGKTDPYTTPAGAVGTAGNVGSCANGPKDGSTQNADAQSGQSALFNAVVKGMIDKAGAECKAMLASGSTPIEVIDNNLIPGLDTVGKSFEEKKTFLPQLLMSADAAKAAFDVIKQYYAENGTKGESKGTVVMATVKGDIHDIGKNIVKVLLENYDYTVIDLGKDVAPETIVDTVLEHNIKLVGLSALMTTTVVSMEETIKQLREKAPFCKVVVGGAVLTQEYADKIGADRYSPQAMDTVKYAKEVFGK
ncbi:MAG: homocysteine S-methyltransferase family protein [Lachnospiraceae bacterium]|nr:homocysteine S-methyltransferase family protein [Lachnospiraceae bacterium]